MKNTLFLKIFLFCLFVSIGNLNAQNSTKKDKEVTNLLEKKRSYNKSNGYGYSIQIYYGNERTARSKHARFKVLYPRVYTKLVYNNPDWKVQVGNYKTKLEADRANLIFKKEFSGTIVVPMKK
ncbi:SPOR domain-containing protein [Polaribacter sp. KT 15]|uniref:SPOR domain-containing protein n=1 Tax=Polaribacter sp. KT 15 TaxID=1896175 RepID=UPI00090ABFFF|nr:SPOR domain-containing protein [Polaribacter sp. KT 15]SHM85208.1 Sporulation related domain-containing protein [Polaribacter sp. KT 15]